MLRRLEHRLPLLTGGAPDLPERQQTLRRTLAWSHDLLGRPEQVLFRRLAVFAGGCTLPAVEAVCVDAELPAGAVFDLLGHLVDHSLLVRRLGQADPEPRFGMLETIHEFAEERLGESGEAAEVQRRQREFCLELAERADPWHFDLRHIGELERERQNVRAALRWSITAQEALPALVVDLDAAHAVRLAAAAAAVRDQLGATVAPVERLLSERVLDRARRSLGDAAYLRAWEDGATLTLPAAMAEAEHVAELLVAGGPIGHGQPRAAGDPLASRGRQGASP